MNQPPELGAPAHRSSYSRAEMRAIGVASAAIPELTAQSVDEIFLTAAQSLLGTVMLLRLRFALRDALLLTGLFIVQFAIPGEGVHVAIGWTYVALAVLYAVMYRREIVVADVIGNLRTVHLVKRLRAKQGLATAFEGPMSPDDHERESTGSGYGFNRASVNIRDLDGINGRSSTP